MSEITLRSMTGFASHEGEANQYRLKIEVRSLNHRHLDIKCRLPRDFSSLELQIRTLLQSFFKRGALELRIEVLERPEQSTATYEPNLAVAASYFESLNSLKKTFGLEDPIQISDLLHCNEILSRFTGEETSQEESDPWPELEKSLSEAFSKLKEMREREGSALQVSLQEAIHSLKKNTDTLRERRKKCEAEYKEKISERIRKAFEAYPLSDTHVEKVLETRIAQELAMILDKTDIEEELTRLKGHIGHFQSTLAQGSPNGRKLDFILQEISREVNTLGNKAQDFEISEEVVQLKVKTEQLREQVMNIE